MTTLYAYDAAFPAPGVVYKAHGGVAANVYVSGTYAQNASHVAALRLAGIAPWPNYERGLWELVSNRAAGQAAAKIGIADAIRCGFPSNGTIWFPFSVDVSVNPTQYSQVADAFQGIQDINNGRYLISCYGQGGLIQYLRAHKVIDQKGWLSSSSSFPGYNRDSPDVCIYQEFGNFITGYSTDRNTITDVTALHAWWPDHSPYGGDDMSATDVQAIINDLHPALSRVQDNINESQLEARTAVAALATTVNKISADVAALKTGIAPAIDYDALAKALAAHLVISAK